MFDQFEAHLDYYFPRDSPDMTNTLHPTTGRAYVPLPSRYSCCGDRSAGEHNTAPSLQERFWPAGGRQVLPLATCVEYGLAQKSSGSRFSC